VVISLLCFLVIKLLLIIDIYLLLFLGGYVCLRLVTWWSHGWVKFEFTVCSTKVYFVVVYVPYKVQFIRTFIFMLLFINNIFITLIL
jgi:hypothetical protein